MNINKKVLNNEASHHAFSIELNYNIEICALVNHTFQHAQLPFSDIF